MLKLNKTQLEPRVFIVLSTHANKLSKLVDKN